MELNKICSLFSVKIFSNETFYDESYKVMFELHVSYWYVLYWTDTDPN